MGERLLPKEPGWFWCFEHGSKLARRVEVVRHGERLFVRRQGLPLVTNKNFQWLGDEVANPESEVQRLTGERDAALARVAMLEAASGADRAMLCRILGVESDASMVALLELVETLLGRRGEP